ncbi:MAG: metallophosphoesterase [bacterium]|nr:metallophosphoesterase [bacterium]
MISRRRFVEMSSLSLAGTFTVGGAGFASAQGLPSIQQRTLRLPEFPSAWAGLKIAQIADVHAGPYMPVTRMRRIRDLVNSLDADLIVFTGDQMDRRPTDADLFVEGFQGLQAPFGVWGILGNHDHYLPFEHATGALTDAGITPLVNRGVEFERSGSSIALVGIDDLQARSPHGPDFTTLQLHRQAFRICLSHQPQSWNQARVNGAHLTISGHTHGGQIALTSKNLNAARLQTRYIAGPYRRDDAFLFVSRGIGVGAVPVRVGAPPEIDVLTLFPATETSNQVAA